MKIIKGIAAASGIAIAKAYELQSPDLSHEKMKSANPETEEKRLNEAIAVAVQELKKIKAYTEKEMSDEHAEIFTAQLLILNDPEWISQMKANIAEHEVIAETAVEEAAKDSIRYFKNMGNTYMRERATDIADVSKRVLAHLLDVEFPDPQLLNEQVIIVSHDLTPSDTAQLNRKYVKGFATNIGGTTSHTAIMARSLEIPAVVGTKKVTKHVKTGDIVILDGIEGILIVNPDEATLKLYQEKQKNFEAQKSEWMKLKNEKTITLDQEQVTISGNISSPNEVKDVLDHGGEAIGLYRTEFLYLGRTSPPSEEEQYQSYKSVLEQMEDKPVIVRTLDIGGDKQLDYLNFPKELNPFLGFRGIRFCLENEDIFRPQLRALLRASVHGNLSIMFPMVATLEEFRAAKALLLEEKKSLLKKGIDVAESINVGMMVELPSTAILARQFAKEVDFFSIGTNDLIQYTMAADRLNEQVSHLYQPYHPAVLHLIHQVSEAAHREGKMVGVCGEMASDSIAIPILLGMDLDNFSMNASAILPARKQIKALKKRALQDYKEDLLSMSTADEVVRFIKVKTKC